MGTFCNTLIVSFLTLSAASATGSTLCGRSVEYALSNPSHHCLLHNSTTSAVATAIVVHHSKVLGVFPQLPGRPLEIPVQPEGSVLSLGSQLTVCYTLLVGGCEQTVRGSERIVRDAHQQATLENQGRANTQKNVHGKMFVWSVVALLVLLPLATASFLCCHGEGKGSGSMKTRTLSKKDRKGIAASTDISINITDSDHPLGSELVTTFHKSDEGKSEDSAAVLKRATQFAATLLEDPTFCSTQHLLESSLDVGTRDSTHGVQHGTSLSSMLSLGPRVPPEGSSLDNLAAIDKPATPLLPSSPSHQPPDMPPPPTVPPPPSHLRQHSTPVSFPPPLSPQLKIRPLTVIGEPKHQRSSGPPALPPKPNPHNSSPPLSPISLSESEALSPVRPGRVRPYRVVHQPSLSHSSLPHIPHGTLCTQCGARLVSDDEPLHLVESGSESANGAGELCQQCQTNNSHYHQLEGSDKDFSPPIPHRNGSPEPDPLYERIGSIRRQHMMSTRKDDMSQTISKPLPPVPSPAHSPNPFTGSSATCFLPPDDKHHFPKCPLPSEGAPLPPRPPTLGLVMGESVTDHNYERLPSTFGVDSPEDSMYAHITTPEAEPESPPYIPENSQRAQMLKIDSQGYAEVVSKEEEEEEPKTPDPGYSPILPLSPASQAVASDYEVPVRVAPSPSFLHPSPTHSHPSPTPVTSPPFSNLDRVPPSLSLPSERQVAPLSPSPSSSLLHPSATRSHPSPIPVASPMPPFSNLDKVPPSLPLPSEHTTTGPFLRRQGAVAENPLPLPTRSVGVLPQKEQHSEDTRRDSSGSTDSFSYRLSNASSGLGESMTESLLAIAEEEGVEKNGERCTKTEPVIMKQKLYEVENRSRTKSYPNPDARPPAAKDVSKRKLKAQTMRMRISFNQDSQTV